MIIESLISIENHYIMCAKPNSQKTIERKATEPLDYQGVSPRHSDLTVSFLDSERDVITNKTDQLCATNTGAHLVYLPQLKHATMDHNLLKYLSSQITLLVGSKG